MIPEIVNFTELELDPRRLLRRKARGPWPTTWTRHQFVVETYEEPIDEFDKWMRKNVQGDWSSYSVPVSPGKQMICIAFQQLNEAIMFRLKGGETAWRKQEEDL